MLKKPRIILVITHKETNAQIKRHAVNCLEIRADLLPKLSPAILVKEITKRKPLKLPILLTVRNARQEGADADFSDEKKWALINEALPLVDEIDIELSSALLKPTVALAHRLKKKVIVSSHHFKSMPHQDMLDEIRRKAKAAGADSIKIAAMANTLTELQRLIKFTQEHQDENVVTMAMGKYGRLSRLTLPLFGSLGIYTFIGQPKAPGQIDIKTLTDHLRFYYP